MKPELSRKLDEELRAKQKKEQSEEQSVSEQPEWNTNKVFDFVNWYLRLCKVVTDSDCRFELENQTVIDSFLKGDDYKLWWKEKGQPEKDKPEVSMEEIKNKIANNNNFDSFENAIRYTFNRGLLQSEKVFINKLFNEAMEEYAHTKSVNK